MCARWRRAINIDIDIEIEDIEIEDIEIEDIEIESAGAPSSFKGEKQMRVFRFDREQRKRPLAGIACLFGMALLMTARPAAKTQLVAPPIWQGYGGNAQHTALSTVPAQPLQTIHWKTPIDLILQNTTGEIFIHYGTPLVTAKNTVLVTVRTTAQNNFQVQAYGGYAGELKWTQATDYTTPPSGWVPSCGSTLAPDNTLYIPGAGGTILHVFNVDRPTVYSKRIAFYGLSAYNANPAIYNSTVYIDTPITCDKAGNLYFGFQVTGNNPTLPTGGLARITPAGVGTWVSAATASGDPNMTKVTNNCAPAISNDGSLVYVSINNGVGSFGGGYLVALDSTTLATKSVVLLRDPSSGSNAIVPDDGTASPMVGPDNDVYYGVLENPFPNNNDRGWMLHFDKMLGTVKTPGAFGWDDTGSVVPAKSVASYTGTSPYLLLTKYNNYIGVGTGNGVNKVAVLDPNATMTDPITGATVMQEVITVTGVTPNGTTAGSVREWCINTAAIDPFTNAAMINSEDGTLYRWDFATNSLSQKVVLTPGVGEAYTPTVIGPDGATYAVNDAVLFSVGSTAPDITKAVTVNPYAIQNGMTPKTKYQVIKVTNVSNCKLPGPISLVLDNLSATAALTNATGVTANAAPLGSPYITLTQNAMNNGDSVSILLIFMDVPNNSPINYTVRVLAGPGKP